MNENDDRGARKREDGDNVCVVRIVDGPTPNIDDIVESWNIVQTSEIDFFNYTNQYKKSGPAGITRP